MPEVLRSALVPADVDAVWRVVRDFDGLPSWHPAIATSALRDDARPDQVAAVRVLGMEGGGEVVERLVSLDETRHTLVYEIMESPFAVRLYRSTIRVVPLTTTGESFVEWSVVFDCDGADAEGLVDTFGSGVFAAGLQGLSEYFSDRSV